MAKITDIGIVGQYRETEKSIVYLSPEVLRNLNVRSKESDVYSYGIMLWEMWYGVEAFNEMKFMPDIVQANKKRRSIYQKLKRSSRAAGMVVLVKDLQPKNAVKIFKI